MTIFDLLFLALALGSVVTLLAAAVLALSGKRARSLELLKRWGIGFAAYMGVVVATSVLLPRSVARLGEALCNDDWCLTVEGIGREGNTYRVGLKMESRAARVTQREFGVLVYLTDTEGRRYTPRAETGEVAFDVPLRPQEAVQTARTFDLPEGVRPAGLVVRYGSGFPIGWFIIGYPTWFRKPTIVTLPA